MPTTQVSLVIETEKKAALIELDARTKAQEILDAAKVTSFNNHQNIKKATDDKIGVIFDTAREQADNICRDVEAASLDKISDLQNTALDHKKNAIQAAVNLLTGRS